MGRHTKYSDDMPELVEKYAREGMIEKDIAKMIGVSLETFGQYKKRFPAFLDALKAGKQVIDHQVEMTLLKSALGYEYIETKRITEPDGKVRIEETTKMQQPSVTAQIFWLKNRQPDNWRDVAKFEILSITKALSEAHSRSLKEAQERELAIGEADYTDITPLES